jgi:replicative DNA helicase
MRQSSKISDRASTSALYTATQVMERLQEYAAMPIVPTGFASLDDLLGGGLRVGQPYTLAAGTGQGKTSLVSQIARQHAARGEHAVIWTLEMDPHHVLARMVAQHTGASSLDVLHARMPQLEHHVSELHERVYFCERADIALFEQAVLGLAATACAPSLVIVDYLQKLASPGQGFREAVTEASERLRSLAKRLNAPLLIVSAVGRESARRIREARDLDPVELIDVCRESGAIEYDNAAVLVLGLDPADEGERQTAVLSVAKNRFGTTGQIELEFEGAIGRFTERGKLVSKRQRDKSELRQEIAQAVARANRPLNKTEIVGAVGRRRETVMRTIEAMARDGELEQTSGGYVLGREHAFPDAPADAGPDGEP